MTVKSVTETARSLSIKKTESRLDEISEKTASRFTTLTFGMSPLKKSLSLLFYPYLVLLYSKTIEKEH